MKKISITPSDLPVRISTHEQRKITFYNEMLTIIERGAMQGKKTWNNEDDFGLFKEVVHHGKMVKTLDIEEWQKEMLELLRDNFIKEGFESNFFCWDASRFEGVPCGCTFTLERKKPNQ